MTTPHKRIAVIGATSTIAMHCMRLWAEEPVALVLVGRDQAKMESIAADLRVRQPSISIQMIVSHFLEPTAIQQLADQIVASGPLDIVLIAHGALPDQSVCERDLRVCHDALAINAISPVLFAEAFVGHMQQANQGILSIIGSVAGDRGRKSNYVYGAAKGLLERYVEGLQHRLAKTQVKAVLIKPGPTYTPMTAQSKQQLKVSQMADPAMVARQIVQGIKQKRAVIYTPTRWVFVMMVIKSLPRFVFNQMDI